MRLPTIFFPQHFLNPLGLSASGIFATANVWNRKIFVVSKLIVFLIFNFLIKNLSSFNKNILLIYPVTFFVSNIISHYWSNFK